MNKPTTWIAKKLTDADRREIERETAEIRERRKTPEARRPHKFETAEWTHPNGHPRCVICGDEEPMGDTCYVEKDQLDADALATSMPDVEDVVARMVELERRGLSRQAARARIRAELKLEGASREDATELVARAERVEKARPMSREYLEEAWTIARKLLPPWAWAQIHSQALPRSGVRAARAAREDSPSLFEKIALVDVRPSKLRELPEDELRLAWLRLHQWYANAKRAKRPVEDFVNAALWTMDEMGRRGLDVERDDDLVRAIEDLRGKRASVDVFAKLNSLPRDLVVVRDFVSVVGSTAKGNKEPEDVDVLLRAPWDRQAGSIAIQAENVWLPLRNALDPDKAGKLHWIDNPQGAHGDYVPLYDLVLRRRDKIAVEVVKGFPNSTAEVGVHVHNLEREASRTKEDGAHAHLYILPDGRRIWTEADGAHSHALGSPTADIVGQGGAHRHRVVVDGEELWTEEDGAHAHQLQVWSSAFDGIHSHKLKLRSGETIENLMPGAYWEHEGRPAQGGSPPAPPAPELARLVKAGPLRVDLGCGDAKSEGYFGIDKRKLPGVDQIADLEQGIPLDDATVDEVRAHHVLEHLADKERIMAEIHRVLRPGGRLVLEVPSTKGEGAFAHPDHKSWWNKSSFAFWSQDELRGDRPKFEVEELEEEIRGDLAYVRAVLRKPAVDPIAKAVRPFGDFTPPKPAVPLRTELFEVDELWEWAEERLPVYVEPKHNGFRAILEKQGDRVRLRFEGARDDVIERFPGLREAARKIAGDFVLDLDAGIERGGKRLPRPELARLNAESPKLGPDEKPVLTAFDLPHKGSDLSGESFAERREVLEAFFEGELKSSGLFKLSPVRRVGSRAELEEAARWAFDQDRSEGLVAKSARGLYETDGGTNEWSKLKRVAELKVIVLGVQRTADGSFNYRGGLLLGDLDLSNTVELEGRAYVDLGKTFNTKIVASEGDVLTVEILELIPDEREKTLAWLGPTVVDVDRARSQPYLARQAIDIAARARVLQKTAIVPTSGPAGAPLALVGSSPGKVEAARGEPFVGQAGETLNELYLRPLGLERSRVVVTNAVPILLVDEAGAAREPTDEEIDRWRGWLEGELDRLKPRVVVALGQVARRALGGKVVAVLPHPAAVRRFGDSGEVERKLRRIREAIGLAKGERVGVRKQPPRGEGGEETRGRRAFDVWEETWHEQLPRSGAGRFVYQRHWRGLDEEQAKRLGDADLLETDHSVHGDLRLEGDDELWGWAVFVGSAADNRKLRAGDKLLAMSEGALGQDKLQLANKLPQPKAWLDVGAREPLVAMPGEVGATSEKWSKFFAVDEGTYRLGVARQHAVEIFLDGKHLKGRYLIQFAPVGDRRVWLIDKPDDQRPTGETRELADLIGELRRKRQKFLIWGKPGEVPQKIDVRSGRVIKSVTVPLLKERTLEDKRIVYGVVLDPYVVDAHDDWVPPDVIEETAHGWFKGSRLVTLHHKTSANARAVESHVEAYPSRSDYVRARLGESHRAWRRQYGDDVVHSGAWIIGVQLDDDLWEAYKRDEIAAFSIEGFGMRTPTTRKSMPQVTFADLIEVRR